VQSFGRQYMLAPSLLCLCSLKMCLRLPLPSLASHLSATASMSSFTPGICLLAATTSSLHLAYLPSISASASCRLAMIWPPHHPTGLAPPLPSPPPDLVVLDKAEVFPMPKSKKPKKP
jgi:hypothetical protein